MPNFKNVLFLITLLILRFLANAQSSTIELISSNLSQPIGYKQIDNNHTICVANRVYSTNSEIIVTKLNNSNAIIWSKAISVSFNDFNKAYSFIIDRDSNIVIVGAVETISSFILKINGNNGSSIYAKQIISKSGARSDRLFKIYQMDKAYSDDYVVSGTIGYPDKHLAARIQKNGTQVWCNEYDIDGGNELMYALTESNNGDIVLGGHMTNSNFDHGIIKLNPSDGSLKKIQRFNISYNSYSNGGFDDAVAIKGSNYIAFSMIVNSGSGNPNFQGIVLYNTQTENIDKIQLYNIAGGSARGISMSYNAISQLIIIGGAFVDAGNNNMFFQEIELNDLTKCKTYKFKNINYSNQSSNVAYTSVDNGQNLLIAAYIANNVNLSLSNLLLGKYNISNSKCIESINTSMLSCTLPAPDFPNHSIVSTPLFGNQIPIVNNNTYQINTLCQDECTPTQKLFRINTLKSKDTVCKNKSYNLPINIDNNLNDTIINIVLYKKNGNTFLPIDSLKNKKNVTFNVNSSDSITEYMIIGKLKCSFNDTIFFTLFKRQIVASKLLGNLFYCQNETINITSNAIENKIYPLQYEWIDSASNSVISNSTSLNFPAKQPITISLKLSNTCSNSIILKTHILVAPIVTDSIIILKKTGCEPLNTEFIHPKTQSFINGKTPFNWQWQINGNTAYTTATESGKIESNILNTFNTFGNYLLSCKMIFASGKTCKIINDSIHVYQSAIADFEFNPSILEISNPEVVLTNKSKFAIHYYWKLLDTNYIIFSPTHTFKQIGIYDVMLIAYANNNCNDTIYKKIELNDDFRFYIPNSFSPNNNGLNESWKPYFSALNLIEITIFNRWGEQLFKSYDNSGEWDGKYKGELCQEGVYMYLIKVKNKRNKWFYYKGTLTLLK